MKPDMRTVPAVEIKGLSAAKLSEEAGELLQRYTGHAVSIACDSQQTIMSGPVVADTGSRMPGAQVFRRQTGKVANCAAVIVKQYGAERPDLPSAFQNFSQLGLIMDVFAADRPHAPVLIESTEVISVDKLCNEDAVPHNILP